MKPRGLKPHGSLPTNHLPRRFAIHCGELAFAAFGVLARLDGASCRGNVALLPQGLEVCLGFGAYSSVVNLTSVPLSEKVGSVLASQRSRLDKGKAREHSATRVSPNRPVPPTWADKFLPSGLAIAMQWMHNKLTGRHVAWPSCLTESGWSRVRAVEASHARGNDRNLPRGAHTERT